MAQMRRDPPHPRAEAARWIEPRPPAICPPERLDERILGGRRLAHDPQNPSIDLPLELSEQHLERLAIAVREAPEQFAIGLVLHVYEVLPGVEGEGSVGF